MVVHVWAVIPSSVCRLEIPPTARDNERDHSYRACSSRMQHVWLRASVSVASGFKARKHCRVITDPAREELAPLDGLMMTVIILIIIVLIRNRRSNTAHTKARHWTRYEPVTPTSYPLNLSQ